MKTTAPADVCLLLEGTYPYVKGGVASWTHDLIRMQDHLTFHLMPLVPAGMDISKPCFTLPQNVTGLTPLHLGSMPEARHALSDPQAFFDALRHPLLSLHGNASLQTWQSLCHLIQIHKHALNEDRLLHSEAAWNLMQSMYKTTMPHGSFIDYFWSWRAMMGSLFSILLCDLPQARCYHTLSTGYAGLLAARARLETGKPVLITEHGIYTNERRIEIASAEWLESNMSDALTVDRMAYSLQDLWIDTFSAYSRICYESADRIITLYAGNQTAQIADGADPKKMQIIPNGIDTAGWEDISPDSSPDAPPSIALIGRVVPIKDVKTYIRACAVLRESIPGLCAFVMGPTEEDTEYYEECRTLMEYLGIPDAVEFTGNVNLYEYLPKVDVVVFTSLSEAQPLVILEAGAMGIPCVATDVGSCRELLEGRPEESPNLGPGGIITPLASPTATADAIRTLLHEDTARTYGANLRHRVQQYYTKAQQKSAYREVYDAVLHTHTAEA